MLHRSAFLFPFSPFLFHCENSQFRLSTFFCFFPLEKTSPNSDSLLSLAASSHRVSDKTKRKIFQYRFFVTPSIFLKVLHIVSENQIERDRSVCLCAVLFWSLSTVSWRVQIKRGKRIGRRSDHPGKWKERRFLTFLKVKLLIFN